jgi:hypothetical protein
MPTQPQLPFPGALQNVHSFDLFPFLFLHFTSLACLSFHLYFNKKKKNPSVNSPSVNPLPSCIAQGTYVLQDLKFKHLMRLSSNFNSKSVAAPYLIFTCGLLRGALANLGVPCTVTPEIISLPTCEFRSHLVHSLFAVVHFA